MMIMTRLRFLLSLCGMGLLMAACSMVEKQPVFSEDRHVGAYKVGQPYQIDGTWYTPKVEEDYEEEGMASWYGPNFHGKLTANGDVFDQHALTAAHRTLPLPSMVRVTNLDNGRSLAVMVNDRGPFSKGRILDLSDRAADILGFKDKGVAKVRVKFLPGQTRRLLTQLESPAGEGNPFATADENFGDADMAAAASSLSEDAFPLPKNFNISTNNTKVIADVNANNAPIVSNEPIGAEPRFGVVEAQTTSSVDRSIEIAPLADMQAEQTSVAVQNEAVLPNRLPDSPNEMPVIVENADIMVVETEKPVQPVFAVPEGKVLLDANDPRLIGEIYYIQVGSYGVEANALHAQKTLEHLGEKVEISAVETARGQVSRVRMGPLYKKSRAMQMVEQVAEAGYPDAMMVKGK